jgi:hypothetical protein
LKTALQSPDTGLGASASPDEPRFALNALGEFVFYNPAFARLADLPMQAERSRLNAAKIFKFAEDHPAATQSGPARRFMDQIGSGTYSLLCGPSAHKARFRFYWV